MRRKKFLKKGNKMVDVHCPKCGSHLETMLPEPYPAEKIEFLRCKNCGAHVLATFTHLTTKNRILYELKVRALWEGEISGEGEGKKAE